jgi:hypothetical protein
VDNGDGTACLDVVANDGLDIDWCELDSICGGGNCDEVGRLSAGIGEPSVGTEKIQPNRNKKR